MATIYTNSSALDLAALVRTALEDSTIHLWQSTAQPISSATVVGDLVECTYSNYEPVAVSSFLPPFLSSEGGGASIQSGIAQFDWAPHSGLEVSNNVNGFWLENSLGDLWVVGDLEAPVSMAHIGDSLSLNIILPYGQ